jgi:hypothetical protein
MKSLYDHHALWGELISLCLQVFETAHCLARLGSSFKDDP